MDPIKMQHALYLSQVRWAQTAVQDLAEGQRPDFWNKVSSNIGDHHHMFFSLGLFFSLILRAA